MRTLPILVFLALTQGCVFYGDYRDLERRYSEQTAALEDSHREIRKWKHDADVQGALANSHEVQANYLRDEVGLLRDELGRLSQEERTAVAGSEGLQFNPRTHGLMLSNEIMFPSGRHELTDGGKRALAALIPRLQSLSDQGHFVRVDGHTDDQAVQRSRDRYRDNWDLGYQRARTVRDYLVAHGLPEAKVSLGVFAAILPVKPGSDAASRKLNRRVELVLVSY